MTDDAIRIELDAIAATQKRAVGWLLGVAATLLVAFILAAFSLNTKVEKIDTLIGERFANIQSSLDRLASTIESVARIGDGRYDALVARIRAVESRVDRIEVARQQP